MFFLNYVSWGLNGVRLSRGRECPYCLLRLTFEYQPSYESCRKASLYIEYLRTRLLNRLFLYYLFEVGHSRGVGIMHIET